MKKETNKSDIIPLHSEIDRIIENKTGDILSPVDFEALANRRNPLAQGLTRLLEAGAWSPVLLDLSLIDELPTSSATRLKVELMKLAVSRDDLSYIAEAVAVHRHKSKVSSELDSSPKQKDLLANLSTSRFSIETIDNLLLTFTTAERRKATVQTALFKLLAHSSIRSRLDDHSRAKILRTFFDKKNRPADHGDKAQKALVSSLLRSKTDFTCLDTDPDLFRTVSSYLATYEKDHSKGTRKVFFDWLRASKDATLLLDEVSWKDLDAVERLSVAGNGIDSKLEKSFYECLIAPKLEVLNATTLLKVAVANKNLARIAIESIAPESLMGLALPDIEPTKLRNDPPALLLHRASKITSTIVDQVEQRLSDSEDRLQVAQAELDVEKKAHEGALRKIAELERRVSELEREVEFETTSRRAALQTELEYERFSSVKELCQVHRGLVTAERLVPDTPAEFREVIGWALGALERMGVDLIGSPGQVVPRDLILHESRSPKGTPVEILQVGYIMGISRAVVLPALANTVTDRNEG